MLKTEPLRLELDRNVQLLKPQEVQKRIEFPPEFYELTAEEARREQRLKKEAAERALTMRTKAQRDQEGLQPQRSYQFCVMRVKFPDGLTLQVVTK